MERPFFHNFASHKPNIWARITKLAPTIHLGDLSRHMEFDVDWHWSSRSISLKFHKNDIIWLCPDDNSSTIWARITKVASKINLDDLWFDFEYDVDWPWPSRLFFTKNDLQILKIRFVKPITPRIEARTTTFAPNISVADLYIVLEWGVGWP